MACLLRKQGPQLVVKSSVCPLWEARQWNWLPFPFQPPGHGPPDKKSLRDIVLFKPMNMGHRSCPRKLCMEVAGPSQAALAPDSGYLSLGCCNPGISCRGAMFRGGDALGHAHQQQMLSGLCPSYLAPWSFPCTPA